MEMAANPDAKARNKPNCRTLIGLLTCPQIELGFI